MKTPRRLWIWQHSQESPAGITLDWAKARGWDHQIFFWPSALSSRGVGDRSEPVLSPPPDSRDLLVVLGGPQNVDEEDKYPWLKLEKQQLLNVIRAGVPTLGLCLGGQLLAEVLGGRAERHAHWEIGWKQLDILPTASSLLPKKSQLVGFQYHAYHFRTPPGARKFATNEITSDQGFVFGDRVVGTQFHPEASQQWVAECATEVATKGLANEKNLFVSSQDKILADTPLYLPDQSRWYFDILDALSKIEA